MPRSLASLSIVVVILQGAFALVHAADTEDVAFTAKADATEQRYVLVLPAEFDPKATTSVLIALHGHGSDRWQFVKDERDECRAARDAAAAHHMIYVSPDYRARTSWMGPAAEVDTLQIIEELRSRFRIGKVVISGGSMGGTAALTFAALHPDQIDGVVSMNGTANLVEYSRTRSPLRTADQSKRSRTSTANVWRNSMPTS